MIVLKSDLPNQEAYYEIYHANPEQNTGYIVKKALGDRIYVKKCQQDLTAQYSTPFVGKVKLGQGNSTIKGIFVPAFQMTIFRILILGLLLYCLIPDFHWNIAEFILLAILFISEASGIRKKHQIKCAVINFMESTFKAEMIFPKNRYRQKTLKPQNEYEIWHSGLYLAAYIIMIIICIPPFSFGVYISVLAKVWYGVVIFIGFVLVTIVAGVIHNEWLWRVHFNQECVALKLLSRKKISFRWDEVGEVGLATISTNAGGIPAGIQVWIYISKDHLVYGDFSKVMKDNERNPEIIWFIYNKKSYEILRQFYKGNILNFDFLKGYTQ